MMMMMMRRTEQLHSIVPPSHSIGLNLRSFRDDIAPLGGPRFGRLEWNGTATAHMMGDNSES